MEKLVTILDADQKQCSDLCFQLEERQFHSAPIHSLPELNTHLQSSNCSFSAGASGFKGAKKGTPFAAQTAADSAGRRAMDQGMRQVEVMVSGPGAGRETG